MITSMQLTVVSKKSDGSPGLDADAAGVPDAGTVF